MTMIVEDYVSFETAKLLKSRGFDIICDKVYDEVNQYRCPIEYKMNLEGKGYYLCPTLQMAMKWLREVHNLCIEPYRTASGYLYTISKIWTGSEIYSDEFNGDDEDSGQWTTYEKACEAAIKYCLENLI